MEEIIAYLVMRHSIMVSRDVSVLAQDLSLGTTRMELKELPLTFVDLLTQ